MEKLFASAFEALFSVCVLLGVHGLCGLVACFSFLSENERAPVRECSLDTFTLPNCRTAWVLLACGPSS